MSLAVGDTIVERVSEIESELSGITDQIQELQSKASPLKAELKTLNKVLKDLGRATSGSNGASATKSPANSRKVEDEEILEVIKNAGKALDSKGVAESLGVDARNVARKLTKLVGTGQLTGDKESGFSLA